MSRTASGAFAALLVVSALCCSPPQVQQTAEALRPVGEFVEKAGSILDKVNEGTEAILASRERYGTPDDAPLTLPEWASYVGWMLSGLLGLNTIRDRKYKNKGGDSA